jgi:hypothetical protein
MFAELNEQSFPAILTPIKFALFATPRVFPPTILATLVPCPSSSARVLPQKVFSTTVLPCLP